MSIREGSRISAWIPVAFAGMGFVIGLEAGLSETPIVATLLPLLFAVIGGGVGFFAIHQVEKSTLVGVALTLFSIAFLLGNVIGITRRVGAPFAAFFHVEETHLTLDLDNKTLEVATQLVRVHAAVEGLSDLTAHEKQQLWKIAVAEADSAKTSDKLTDMADSLNAIPKPAFSRK